MKNSDNLQEQIKLDPPECVYSKFMAPFGDELVFPSKEQAKEVSKSSVCTFNFFVSTHKTDYRMDVMYGVNFEFDLLRNISHTPIMPQIYWPYEL